MDHYTQKNGLRVFQLQKAISVVAQENSSISYQNQNSLGRT
jgi:hypothetical protein